MANQKNKTSIIFTGDIGFDRYMDQRWKDENLLSQPLLDFFHSADHVAANVEGALIDAVDDGSRGVFFHAMNPAATKVLKDMHADIWCVGNNHTMDAGKEGVISTRRIAQEMGCLTIGAGLNEAEASEPIYLDEAGGIGMFGVAYMAECIPATATEPGIFRWDDMDYIKRRIDEVKSKCRWCVVVSHGGEEFTSMPSPYTRDRYLRYLELGADVVVAHHPHVPENYELFPDGKAIFYSLGNFIFDTNYQRAHLYTDVGVLLKLIFTEEKLDFEAMGIRGSWRRPSPTSSPISPPGSTPCCRPSPPRPSWRRTCARWCTWSRTGSPTRLRKSGTGTSSAPSPKATSRGPTWTST